MARTYGVYWRTEKDQHWTLAIGCPTASDAERLKCRLMGMPRGRDTVQRTTVIDFDAPPDLLPLYVPVGREVEWARSTPSERPVVTNWKPARSTKRAPGQSAPKTESPRPPRQRRSLYWADDDEMS